MHDSTELAGLAGLKLKTNRAAMQLLDARGRTRASYYGWGPRTRPVTPQRSSGRA
jgi:hypothetical protein